MAIVSAQWNKADDIHVLEPSSGGATATTADLRDNLEIIDDSQSSAFTGRSPPPGTTVTFNPVFEFTSIQHGVSVDHTSGIATVRQRALGTLPHNFIIDARVMDSTGKEIVHAAIRIHIHQKVNSIVLSPPTLSVRLDQPSRFTVLATFDDGVVGNLSDVGVSYSFPNPSTNIDIAPDGSITAAVLAPIGAVTAVRGTLPASFGGVNAIGQTVVASVWGLAQPATRIHGPGGPTVDTLANVLFISEGFTGTQQTLFEDTARSVVDAISHSRLLSPLNRLVAKGQINFFTTWVPSAQESVSEAYDLKRTVRVTNAEAALAVDTPTRPGSGNPVVDLPTLIYQVGLPVLTESDATGAGFAQKKSDWTSAYSATQIGGLTSDLYLQWANLADHFIAPELDTALSLRYGLGPPQVLRNDDGRSITWSPLRTQRTHVDALLKLLTDGPGGPKMGDRLWGNPDAKDRALVVALCGGGRYGGANTGKDNRLIAVGLSERSEVLLSDSETLLPQPIKSPPPLTAWGTVAHELCHSLNLGDEYGGVNLTSDAESRLAASWNVQENQDLLTSNALDGDKAQWRWPRISAASLLDAQPSPAPDGFEITVKPGKGRLFKANDVVQLRKFPFLVATGIPAKPQLQAVSGKLTVVDVSNDVILAQTQTGTTIDVSDWQQNAAILFTANGDTLLMSEEIALHITSTHLPLNRTPPTGGANPPVCAVDRNLLQPAANTPPNLIRPKGIWSTAFLVGLYDGGVEVFCGFYHPSGTCLMRSNQQDSVDPNLPPDITRLCPVCKYIIAETLDPSLHGAIDGEYARTYPTFT